MPKIKPNVFDQQAITANDFFHSHWQRAPYLFTQTTLDLTCLPNQAELFALAAKPGVQSRIVYTEDDQHFQAIYDDPKAWNEVVDCKPTLLVSDIEKWHPAAQQLLRWFPFIKSWRFDDLMMSYAPTGASVGAHTDHYDVFLVQVQGTRQWSYDRQPLADVPLVVDSELAVIDGYRPEISHELKPGDVLYLPPGIPHHGIATSDDCVTCSIGLRAPSVAELLSGAVEQFGEQLPAQQRFQDAVTTANTDASIGPHEINHLRTQLQALADTDEQTLAQLFGRLVTGYRLLDAPPWDEFAPDVSHQWWQKSPFSVFAYHLNSDSEATLFVDGESWSCDRQLAQIICDQDRWQLKSFPAMGSDQAPSKEMLEHLLETQALIPADRG